MNKKNKIYTEAPISVSKTIREGEIVTDFLPPPEKLVRREPKVKIIIAVNNKSINNVNR